MNYTWGSDVIQTDSEGVKRFAGLKDVKSAYSAAGMPEEPETILRVIGDATGGHFYVHVLYIGEAGLDGRVDRFRSSCGNVTVDGLTRLKEYGLGLRVLRIDGMAGEHHYTTAQFEPFVPYAGFRKVPAPEKY